MALELIHRHAYRYTYNMKQVTHFPFHIPLRSRKFARYFNQEKLSEKFQREKRKKASSKILRSNVRIVKSKAERRDRRLEQSCLT